MTTIKVYDLSTTDSEPCMEFMGVSPAHAVAYAYYTNINQMQSSWFFSMCHKGFDWNNNVAHGERTVSKGDYCAFKVQA